MTDCWPGCVLGLDCRPRETERPVANGSYFQRTSVVVRPLQTGLR